MTSRFWPIASLFAFGLVSFLFFSYWHNAKPKHQLTLLVVDMPVDDQTAQSMLPETKFEIAAQSRPPTLIHQETCASDLDLLEEVDQGKAARLSVEAVSRIKNIAVATHGYHILGLVSRSLQSWRIVHLGLSSTPEDGIKNVDLYIKTEIVDDLKRLREALALYSPDLVQLASSDTFEENEQDLISAGSSPSDARRDAKRIMETWSTEWEHVFHDFPATIFVVAAGNGGMDGSGDLIISGNPDGPLPASLSFKNMIRVGAVSKERCISKFSNTGADVAADGVEIPSTTGCKNKAIARFSGTSQASAIFTHYLASGMEAGRTVKEMLSTLKKEPCLEGKVRFGEISVQ